MSSVPDPGNWSGWDLYRERVASLRDELSVPWGASVDELVDDRLDASADVAQLDARRSDADLRVDVLDRVTALGPAGLLARRAAVRRYIREDGLTYGTTSDRGTGRWDLDPIPVVIENTEWRTLERGLQQRAELFDALLADLYGPRRMLTSGVIPPAVVLGHDGFVPAADGVRLPGGRQLVLSSVNLARDTSGEWLAVGDRNQAPSGAGYAMADRRIVARAMPRLYRGASIGRMRSFFEDIRETLVEHAPADVSSPRIVLLSPGPESETAFDQAFMANLLGVPVVQAEDLSMRDGRVWRRTTGRPEQVHVILRRVDAEWSDPLDLRGDSRLGIPGLLEAARRGMVSVVNPLGSGVLENPGLMPYLDAACHALLGEPLQVQSPRTWWCGDVSAAEALERLDQLVARPISHLDTHTNRFGWTLSAAEVADLRAEIAAEPWRWALQEPVAMSTAPVITSRGLEPRRLVLRTFGVGDKDGYRIMPGGLGRVSADGHSWIVSSSHGAVAKDIWIAASSEQADADVARLSGRQGMLPVHQAADAGLSPRVADDLYWLGRYAERAEFTSRLVIGVEDLVADHHGRAASPGQVAMHTMWQALHELTGVTPRDENDHPERHLERMVVDADTPGTIGYSVDRLVRAAYSVRELQSLDTWLVVDRLEEAISKADLDDEPLVNQLRQLLESLIALAGLSAENTVRDAVWCFTDLGRRVERAQEIARLLQKSFAAEHAPVADGQINEAVLRTLDSAITFRRRLVAAEGPMSPFQIVLELALLDDANPRSLDFQLARIERIAAMLADDETGVTVAALRARLHAASLEELSQTDRGDLAEFTRDIVADLRGLSDRITRTYFARKTTQVTFNAGRWGAL